MLPACSITDFMDEILYTTINYIKPRDTEQKKQFIVRSTCIQTWFIRCSWFEKVETLTLLLEELKSMDSLGTIVQTLEKTILKTINYVETQLSSNFVYDKIIHDHNRGLHEETLNKVQMLDLNWFAMQNDKEQVMIIIGLLKLGGGSLLSKIYNVAKSMYNERQAKSQEPASNTVIFHEDVENNTVDNKSKSLLELQKSDLTAESSITTNSFNLPCTSSMEFEHYDPKNPLLIQVQRRRKEWNEIMNKYKKQIEGKKATRDKGDTSRSSKTSNKSEKSSDTFKSKKAKNKMEGVEIDQIQLLPIWVVKKIFNYLNNKTLNQIKEVNKYWEYVVIDLQKDIKTRKILNKTIAKLEECLDVQEDMDKLKPILRTSKYEEIERVRKLNNRGAICNSLRKELEFKNLNNNSVAQTITQAITDYILPVTDLQLFPRILSIREALYKSPACLITPLGFLSSDFHEQSVISNGNVEENN